MTRLLALIDRSIQLFIAACMGTIMVVIALQVVMRATVGALPWPEELSVILMLWGLLLAAAYTLNERGHVGIQIFVDMLGPRRGALISALMHFVIILFCAAVIWGAYDKVASVWNLKTGALRISRAVPQLAIPVSAGAFIVVCLRLIAEDIAIWRRAS